MKYLMGIDISTTASKVLVVDAHGRIIASHSTPHTLSTPYPQWSEQAPEEWWQATCESLRHVLSQVSPDEIASIGLTGQMHGLVILDANGQPLRPAILWNDQRSYLECEEITAQLGSEYLYQHIGGKLIPCFFTPKLKWLQKHEPDIYQKITHILLPKDYIRYRLSGDYITDVADGSGFGLMDIAKRNWSPSLLSALNIPSQWLPALCESPEVCCRVSHDASTITSLLQGTPIVGGASDQGAQSIGCGISGSDTVGMAVGTSGVIYSVTSRYFPEPQGRLNTFCHAIPGTWCYMGVTMSAAGSMQWIRNTLAPNDTYSELDDLAAKITAGSEGLIFTPYLSGERHPHSDALVRAAWIGLTRRHTLSHMTRAVMEGVAFSLKDVLELFNQQGIYPQNIAISGGAANSQLWRQIIANVTQLPLFTMQSNEGAAFGAAILAAVGVKIYPDVASACQNMVHRIDAEKPEEQYTHVYRKMYQIYKSLYPLLQETYSEIAKI